MVGAAVAWLGLGSNLGHPEQQIAAAIQAIAELPHTRLLSQSSLYESAAWGTSTAQPDYLNAVVAIETTLGPQALLDALHHIERARGRVRAGERYAARTLDIDLLLHGDRQIDTAALTLPHPRLHERAFVLLPLVEIAPTLSVPGRGRVADLLAALSPAEIAGVRKFGRHDRPVSSENH
ncbi:MAG: 2-amino-4-hydroxy-6-hydroxymethyldihydropteridine diphosphokinase [Burkholderiales bacterium]|nr:2-amino-4-hydroxy-6-hydroxymethyldihydropteridine diphosphokinase [Burkholderiales bacterium]